MIIVSACLAGLKCRYDSSDKICEKVVKLVKEGKAIPVCPEQMGGLSTPRCAAERVGDRIVTKNGENVTEKYMFGVEESMKIVKMCQAKKAIVKSKSPTCGCGMIYDGTFSGNLIKGDGIFVDFLKENDIQVKTEKEI